MISVAPIIKNSRHVWSSGAKVCHHCLPPWPLWVRHNERCPPRLILCGPRSPLTCGMAQGAPPVQSHFNTIPREVPSWVNHSVSLFCTEPSNGFHQSRNESQSPSQSGHHSVPQHHLLLLFPSPPSVPSTPGSLLFLAGTRPIPTSEPLCLLFLLPGGLFLQTAAWLPTSLSSVLCSNSTFPGSPFGTSLFTLRSPPTQIHAM